MVWISIKNKMPTYLEEVILYPNCKDGLRQGIARGQLGDSQVTVCNSRESLHLSIAIISDLVRPRESQNSNITTVSDLDRPGEGAAT
jgi:hypothetical protein